MVNYFVEMTDTFGGMANYSWVKRYSFTIDDRYLNRDQTRRIVVKTAKKLMGLTGVRGRGEWNGSYYTFKPYNACTIMFIDRVL